MTARAESLRGIMAKADENIAVAKIDMEAGFAGAAASHAYYAAFHSATAALATLGLSFSSHRQTIGAFNREFVKTGSLPPEAGGTLQNLFEHRQTADYDWQNSVDAATAAKDLAAAQAIVEACRRIVEASITPQ